MSKLGRNSFVTGAFLAGFGSLVACGSDNPIGSVTDAVCCKDFKPGADFASVTFGIEDATAQARFRSVAQLAGDVSATATDIQVGVQTACQNMAVDFGATDAEQADAASKGSGGAGLKAWCDLALAKIQASLAAGGTLAASGVASAQGLVKFDPPRCDVNANFQARCEASCTAKAECQLTPAQVVAQCEPGKLAGTCEASCTGTCEGSVSASAACEGSCSAQCEGSCEVNAQAPKIDCDGTCAGTCEGSCETAAGTQTGFNGSCSGTCTGKCNAKCTYRSGAVSAKCDGKCTGRCSGSCKFEANAKVKCDAECRGGCSVEYKAPRCTVEVTNPKAECKADAKCEGNCSASANARAECRPPSVIVAANFKAAAAANIQAAAQLKSLEVNLPAIVLAIQGKIPQLEGQVKTFVGAGLEIALEGDISAYSKATGCFVPISDAISTAATNLAATIEASVKIGGVFGINKG